MSDPTLVGTSVGSGVAVVAAIIRVFEKSTMRRNGAMPGSELKVYIQRVEDMLEALAKAETMTQSMLEVNQKALIDMLQILTNALSGLVKDAAYAQGLAQGRHEAQQQRS